MDSIYITGGKPLKGRIPISGAKNAALTLMPCALLTDEKVTLENLPRLADVDNFSHLLNQLGVSTSVAGVKKGEFGRKMTLQANDIASTVAPYDMVRRMRASILVLGPMLARAGESTVSLPGGCAIGDRPIDLHLQALEAIGPEVQLAAGYGKAPAPKGPAGQPARPAHPCNRRPDPRRLDTPGALGRRRADLRPQALPAVGADPRRAVERHLPRRPRRRLRAPRAAPPPAREDPASRA